MEGVTATILGISTLILVTEPTIKWVQQKRSERRKAVETRAAQNPKRDRRLSK